MVTNEKIGQLRFSIRWMLALVILLSIGFAVAGILHRRAALRRFQQTVVRPITSEFVSSVGYTNGRVLWLRLNSINPEHPKGNLSLIHI